MDAMLGARRTRPLTIAGPRDLRPRMDALREALFPGSGVMTPKFPIEWIAMEPGRPHPVLDLVVTPEHARHTRGDQSHRAARAGGRAGGDATPATPSGPTTSPAPRARPIY